MSQRTSCVVCGTSDARVLSTTTLADGTRAVVCGSHELAHHRGTVRARTLEELRRSLAERRRSPRRTVHADELAGTLSQAFSAERRRLDDRRQ